MALRVPNMDFDLPSWMSMKSLTPGVRLTLPPAYFFKIPPSDFPKTLPPPSDHPTLAHPFTIPIDIYNAALSPNVPILAALGYATVITALNAVNERRKYRPWAFSKTCFFKIMVITHNIILATYSAWTFVGMINALKTSFYPPWEEQGLAGTLDSLCKIHGPRGPGSAAVPGESTSAWSIANHLVHLGADGLTPETTDVGRIWNQGLAFYGWLFYLSKFYEVIDTLIIIAKGKKSSFLQTFHHAGAMICMWAGMRYMSAPIWMFVLVNSFIHSIMYTFYLCSAIGVRVPVWFKRTLTTLQITQFVVGASYAFAHLFIKYQSPVSVPYIYHLGSVASSAALDASSTASSVFTAATAVATDDWPALLKKLALRAAGREGLAQNVYDHSGHTFGVDAVKAVQDWVAREETRYRDDLVWTNCLDTSGQAFAVLLNVVYLLPLTWLFANFFIRSYLQRVERRRSSTASQKAQLARESANDAAKRSSRRLSQAFEDPQAGVEDTGDEATIFDGEKIKAKIDKTASKLRKETANAASNARESMSNGVETVKEESGKLSSKAEKRSEETITSLKREASHVASRVKEEAGPVAEEVEQGMATTLDNLKAQTDSLKAKAQENYEAGLEYAKEGYEKTKTVISSLATGRDGQKQPNDGDSGSQGSDAENSSKAAETESLSQSTEVDKDADISNDTSQDHDSMMESSTSKQSDLSQTDESASSSVIRDTDEDKAENKESTATRAKGQGANRGDEELSSKEKVQQQDSNAKVKAEASTGDAKEDDSPAEQSSTKDHDRKTTASTQKPDKEEQLKQDTSIKGSKGEDVFSQKTGGQGTLEKAADAARDTASNVVETVQDTIENPPPVVKDTTDKVQDNLREAQGVVSNVLEGSSGKNEQGSTNTTSSKSDAAEGHDYEDQKESWIHIPQTLEEGAEKAKKFIEREASGNEKAQASQEVVQDKKSSEDRPETLQTTKHAGSEKESEPDDRPARPESPAWFEKLTSGIDSPSKVKPNPHEDKVIDESEALRDNVVDETSKGLAESDVPTDDHTSGNKQEQDRIIDESEAVRTEPVDQKDSDQKQGSSTSDSKDETADTSAAIPKEEQDKIIAESEPVRDDVKDTEAEAGA